MKLIVSADKVKPTMKWVVKNIGPLTGSPLNIIKETVIVNGKPELTYPLLRKGDGWTFKDLSRDKLDSILEFDAESATVEEIELFNHYLNDTLSDEDNIIFTLKYL